MTEKVCGMTGLKELRDNVRDHTDDNPAGGSDKVVSARRWLEIQRDRSILLRKRDSKEIESLLRHLDKRREDNEQRLEAVGVNLDRCRKNGELISREEAIIAASMPGISYGDKVDSSGDIYHDELLRTLEKSRILYEMGMNSVMKEQNRLFADQQEYNTLDECISDYKGDLVDYIVDYYMKNLSPPEGADLFSLSQSQFNRNAREAIDRLTAEYNRRIEEQNQAVI